MARSIKRGLDYFSVDVGLFADRKVKRVMHACGPEAVAVLLKVWCIAYDEHGYYAQPDGDFFFDIASELGVGEDYVKTVIDKAIEAGLFDSGLYERCGILTSRRMQNNFLDATKKRTLNNKILSQYCLVSGAQSRVSVPESTDSAPESSVSAPESSVSAPESSVSVPLSTQSKVKHSKEEESKQEHGGGGGVISFGEFVHMAQSEFDKLCTQYGYEGAKRMTEMLGLYKASTGKQYASDYHAILSWVVKRWKEEKHSSGRASFERPIGNYDHLAVDIFADDDS